MPRTKKNPITETPVETPIETQPELIETAVETRPDIDPAVTRNVHPLCPNVEII